eukprot:1757446-Ditylum_brightwellii.AAC.1
MLLGKHEKWSSGKWTKQLKVRNFFIKDQINNGEVEVNHCGTENMVANYVTETLQRWLFCKFQKAILNLENE